MRSFNKANNHFIDIKSIIVFHINYRDVFNAPVLIIDLYKWINASSSDIRFAIDELIKEKSISELNGYLVVAGKEGIIADQPLKIQLSEKLTKKGERLVRFIKHIPFIKYVGISGSIAAKNPTTNTNGHVDLDLFIICSDSSLWLLFLFERFYTNLEQLIKGDHFYCFNYVTEESFLTISNKSFYTASEIINLQTLYDNSVIEQFLESNNWYLKYYSPKESELSTKVIQSKRTKVNPLKWLNVFFFYAYNAFRAMKNLDIKKLFLSKREFDPYIRHNYQRISNPNGGYENVIRDKFVQLMHRNFQNYYDDQVVDFLFPDSIIQKNIDQLVDYSANEIDDLFTKYS